MRILIIKTSSLGDVVHNLPVIADIKAHFPLAQIDWVVEESFAEIPSMHPNVSNIIKVAMRRWRKTLFSKQTWCEIIAFKRQLQSQKYDVVIDTQGLLKSALLSYFSRSPNKCGYDKNSIREPLASWFYDKTYHISYQQHAVTRNRALVAMSLGYAIPTITPDYGISPEETHNNGSATRMDIGLQACPQTPKLIGKCIIALHGTSRDSKLWPIENWVELGRELAKQNLGLVLPWASDAEFSRANLIASQLSNATVLPKLGIAQVASVVNQAQAAVGVDTGLSHLAAALNKHVVAIYTDTNPALTGVMAGARACVNLGGKNMQPTPEEVMAQLNSFNILTNA